MAVSTGIAKQLRYKKEATWGVAPGATGAQLLRRITSDINLTKATYESAEIRSDYQVADFRHGSRSVEGSVNGELSLGTWKDFLAAALRKAWVAGATAAAVSVTVAGNVFNRAAGSWLTDGFKVGDVVRFAAFTGAGAPINGVNLRVIAVTAADLTVAETVPAVTPAQAVDVSVPGSKVLVPISGHTNDSFYIEHWHSDIAQSERFAGCRVSAMALNLPSTGMATINTSFMGKDMASGTAAYFTSPSPETVTPVMAAVNGSLRIGSADIGLVTSMSLNIDCGMSTDTVIGSNFTPDVFAGRVRVNGQMTAYFEDGALRDAFINETEVAAHIKLNDDGTNTGDFMTLHMPRIKLGSATKDDGEKGIIQTISYSALLPVAAAGYDQSTLIIQDSTIA